MSDANGLEKYMACEACLKRNKRAEELLESMKNELKQARDQEALWKQICREEISRSWWSKLWE